MLTDYLPDQEQETMRHYTQLTLVQRYQIYTLFNSAFSLSYIAREVGVHKSTVSRELRRCNGRKAYQPDQANDQAMGIRIVAHKHGRIHGELRQFIHQSLKEERTPEQISGTLALRCNTTLSFQSIYRYIQRDNWLGGTLFKNLPRIRKQFSYLHPIKRRPSYRQGPVCNRVSIKERPAIVDQKSRIGDFEIDTIIGRDHQSALLTINDRYSRYLFINKLSAKSAKATMTAAVSALSPYKNRVHTITSDNGSEFARHQDIAAKLEAKFYFADPYSSWQRGANENANGLIRRRFPKKTDFRKVSNCALQDLAFALNNKPRKCLGYRTPSEVFFGMEPHWLKDIPVALIG